MGDNLPVLTTDEKEDRSGMSDEGALTFLSECSTSSHPLVQLTSQTA